MRANGKRALHSGSGSLVFKEVNIPSVVEAMFGINPVMFGVVDGTAGRKSHTVGVPIFRLGQFPQKSTEVGEPFWRNEVSRGKHSPLPRISCDVGTVYPHEDFQICISSSIFLVILEYLIIS